MQFVFTISNLRGPEPPTLQTRTTCSRNSASRGKNCNYGPPRHPVNNEANLLHHVT